MSLARRNRRMLPLVAWLAVAACGDDATERAVPPGIPAVRVFVESDAAAMGAVLERYTAETGVPIHLTSETGHALVSRLIAEKRQSTADLLLARGVAHLWRAVEEDTLRPTVSEALSILVPDHLRDPDSYWFGLLVYARVIAYDRRVVEPSELSGYAGLGEERWHGSLCLSAASQADNRALVAMMIAEHGERAVEHAARAWVENLARAELPDDVAVLEAIDGGQCSVGVVGSDVAERYTRDNTDTAVAVYWPPASAGGAYINVVAAGVTRHAGNPGGAQSLLEWLAGGAGQELLAGASLQYPLNQELPAEQNPADIAGAGYYHDTAVKLMQRARYGSHN